MRGITIWGKLHHLGVGALGARWNVVIVQSERALSADYLVEATARAGDRPVLVGLGARGLNESSARRGRIGSTERVSVLLVHQCVSVPTDRGDLPLLRGCLREVDGPLNYVAAGDRRVAAIHRQAVVFADEGIDTTGDEAVLQIAYIGPDRDLRRCVATGDGSSINRDILQGDGGELAARISAFNQAHVSIAVIHRDSRQAYIAHRSCPAAAVGPEDQGTHDELSRGSASFEVLHVDVVEVKVGPGGRALVMRDANGTLPGDDLDVAEEDVARSACRLIADLGAVALPAVADIVAVDNVGDWIGVSRLGVERIVAGDPEAIVDKSSVGGNDVVTVAMDPLEVIQHLDVLDGHILFILDIEGPGGRVVDGDSNDLKPVGPVAAAVRAALDDSLAIVAKPSTVPPWLPEWPELWNWR